MIVERYKKEGWGIFDETTELADAKWVMLSCNAYYGDVSGLSYDAMDLGLPVMIQNIDIKE